MSNRDVENIVKGIKQHVEDNFPKGVSVPSPDEAGLLHDQVTVSVTRPDWPVRS
ncbi:hypothetical protein H7J76_15850 [Mycolicibacterium fortuitum]|nr:hypothetical protein [Mycolicibacterium fortuitum]